MINRLPHRWIILSTILLLVIALANCVQNEPSDIRGPQFASETTCKNCHKDIYQSYSHTGHFQTSSAFKVHLAQYMEHPQGLDYAGDEKVVLQQKNGKLFQVDINKNIVKSYPIQVAFGSGEKAQTFAYWKFNQLYELPLTFLSDSNRWVNSPGFDVEHAYFGRAIESRCLECHSSYVGTKVSFTGMQRNEELLPGTILYGIDCQRCHGPAANHVKFQMAHPEVKEAKYIVKYRDLGRSARIDVCGVCHSGNDHTAVRSTFKFQPGDTLANYFYPDYNINAVDVHGKQVQQLMQSQCYLKSADLDCVTCHSVHQKEQDISLFNQKCISCHQDVKHQIPLNEKNCIDCHMPLQASGIIKFEAIKGNKLNSYYLRSHVIKVY